METVGYLIVGGHLLVAVLLAGFGVGNYTQTGNIVAVLPPLAIAVMVVGLGIAVARIAERRD